MFTVYDYLFGILALKVILGRLLVIYLVEDLTVTGNVAAYKWKVHNVKIEIISFVANVSFLTDVHCRFLCIGQGMKQT
jgi:hypothetical protein